MRVALLIALMLILTLCQGQRAARLRKDACPAPGDIRLRLRSPMKENFYRGSCEQRAAQRDTCRQRMSCCENFLGDLLCVRARNYFPKFPLQNAPLPSFPPLPPMFDMMQNDVEQRNPLCPAPKPLFEQCSRDMAAKMCSFDFECSNGRVCCPDPCPSDLLSMKYCLLPVSSAQAQVPPPPVGAVSAPADPINEGIRSKTPQAVTTKTATTGDIISPHPSCPALEKPGENCNEDGSQCAVACASYDPSYNECADNSECTADRVCCQDPCPNSPLKLCFPMDRKTGRVTVP
ncbi:uncharacterized protein [Watersipora subatra]|uniref:uncharacterized protein isoform X2 n=1 Tax=Watersipora subatra TaxID=2589382 RepID=UPI00355C393B